MPQQSPQKEELTERSDEELAKDFDLEQLDKLYSNSPVENAFKNIQLKPKKEEKPVPQEEVKEVEKVEEEPIQQTPQPQQEVKPVEVVEEKVEEEPTVEQPQVINIEQPSDELTEEDLDMISELDVELHEANVEEQKAQEKASEPIIPKYIDDKPEEPSLPVFPQPELQSNKNTDFEKNDSPHPSRFLGV